MSSSRFQSIWRIAVILAVILAMFTVLFVSCTKAPAGSGDPVQAKRLAAASEATAVPSETGGHEAGSVEGEPDAEAVPTEEPVIVVPG